MHGPSSAVGTAAGSATADFAYFSDGGGNVVQLASLATDANDVVADAIQAHYEYSPFGSRVNDADAAEVDNPFRFSTKLHDDFTDLYYFGKRRYDPATARWMTRDPLGEFGGLNLYGYVRNFPTGAVDPIGLEEGVIDFFRTFLDRYTTTEGLMNHAVDRNTGSGELTYPTAMDAMALQPLDNAIAAIGGLCTETNDAIAEVMTPERVRIATNSLAAVGGAMEIAGAFALVAATCGAGMPLAVIMAAHGADTMGTSLVNLATGQDNETQTYQAAYAATGSATAARAVDTGIGMIDVPIAIASVIKNSRTIAKLAKGLFGLSDECGCFADDAAKAGLKSIDDAASVGKPADDIAESVSGATRGAIVLSYTLAQAASERAFGIKYGRTRKGRTALCAIPLRAA